MDLLLIPILLSLGGGLIYLSLNGAPRVSFEQFTGRFNRDPFKLNDWMHRRPAVSRARANQVSPEDAELVDLMNEMIAVREQLTDLKLARAPRPIRRQARKPAIAAAPPVVMVELSVAVEEPATAPVRETTPVQKSVPAFDRPATRETSSKLPQPVRATTEMPAMPKELLKQTTTKVTEKKLAADKAPAAEKQTARRPSYTGHNRRYVRT